MDSHGVVETVRGEVGSPARHRYAPRPDRPDALRGQRAGDLAGKPGREVVAGRRDLGPVGGVERRVGRQTPERPEGRRIATRGKDRERYGDPQLEVGTDQGEQGVE